MLGEYPKTNDDRDAVHIAIIPMIAGEALQPGDRVRKVDGEIFKTDDAPIGIVDPFLSGEIRRGKRVWLCLFPNQVIGMRHHWKHAAFIPKEESELWLRNFCNDNGSIDFATLIGELNNDIFEDKQFSSDMDEDTWSFYGIDASGNIPEEFWLHAENYLGKTFYYRPKYFSCSC